MKSKTSVSLIAAILIGAAIFTFVAYTTYDAIGFGSVVEYDILTPGITGVNQTTVLTHSSGAAPTELSIWNSTESNTTLYYNGTLSTTNWTWNGGNSITLHSLYDEDIYPPDTVNIRANYTGTGAAARGITGPAVILVAVLAIIVVAGVMVSRTKTLGGKKGGKGGKSFP